MKKKIFTLFAALTLSAGALFASDTAVDGIYYDFDATNLTATVTYRGSYSSEYDEYTGDVVIPATVTYGGKSYSVTSIGENAFWYCSGLTSVTIPNSVTSIGSYAFSGCSGLTSVTISNSVTSIGSYAFRDCSGLTSVTIPNSVTSIGYRAFEHCSSLTSVTIPNSVTSIGGWAFDGTAWLANQPDGVIYINQMLYTYKGEMPANTSIVVRDGTTQICGGAFGDCSGLTSVTIPNSVTSIGMYAFSDCSGLTSVTIPNSVTSIGDGAFENCSGLTSLTIPNSIMSIGEDAFQWCYGLTSLTIPNSVTSIGKDAFSSVPNIVYSGTATGSPWGARSVNGYVEGYLVYESEAKTQLLTCSSAATGEIIIPNSVTSIGGSAFRGCRGLTSVTIPNSVTSIGSYAFEECSGLTSVTIPNSVTSIGMYAFEGCSGLTSVLWNAKNFADFAEYYDEYDNKYHYGPFCNIASQITSFTFGSEVEHIPAYLCSGMENLTSVTIPNNVMSIGDYAFRGCSGLTSVTIGNSVTSIGDWAFRACSGLTSVIIGNSVTSIGKSAFGECTQLINIVCYAAEPPSCDASSFANYDASLKVPCSSLEAYKADAVWGSFNNISCIGSTVGLEQIELAGLYTQAGRIVCEGEFCIYDLLGRDVTRLNGSLSGVYVVKTANAAQKVIVK